MTAPPPAPAVRYGDHPDQLANLHLPAADGGPWPVVVLVHGGFWRERWDRTTTTPLARDLAARGYLAWNVEYRRVGQPGGGWPGTLEDVAAAVDALAEVEEADPERVVAVGHSAGGHLALWLAATHRLPAGAPGAEPRVRVRAAVSLAGVCDLERAAAEGLGDGAVADFARRLSRRRAGPLRRRLACRAAAARRAAAPRPRLGRRGGAAGSGRDYAEAARAAGDEVELVELAGADHFDVIDPGHEAWAAVVARLPRLLALAAVAALGRATALVALWKHDGLLSSMTVDIQSSTFIDRCQCMLARVAGAILAPWPRP